MTKRKRNRKPYEVLIVGRDGGISRRIYLGPPTIGALYRWCLGYSSTLSVARYFPSRMAWVVLQFDGSFGVPISWPIVYEAPTREAVEMYMIMVGAQP